MKVKETVKFKIKTGDLVRVIAGKDTGKTGKVLQAFPRYLRVSVEGVNIMVKNLRPRTRNEKGQKVEYPAPLHISNVQVVCPKCAKPTRIGHKILEDKKKARICKKCKEIIA
jgi:large subunit ribosomal protein L24